jgi:hypothetical protein
MEALFNWTKPKSPREPIIRKSVKKYVVPQPQILDDAYEFETAKYKFTLILKVRYVKGENRYIVNVKFSNHSRSYLISSDSSPHMSNAILDHVWNKYTFKNYDETPVQIYRYLNEIVKSY